MRRTGSIKERNINFVMHNMPDIVETGLLSLLIYRDIQKIYKNKIYFQNSPTINDIMGLLVKENT